MLEAVQDYFNKAPAWTNPNLKPGPADVRAVTFRRPEDPSDQRMWTRYYQPAGESLAASASRAGCHGPEEATLSIEEEPVIVTVRFELA
jgi:hypothetical protein